MTDLTLRLLVSPVCNAGTCHSTTAGADVCDRLGIRRRVLLAGSRVPLAIAPWVLCLLPGLLLSSLFGESTCSATWRIEQC